MKLTRSSLKEIIREVIAEQKLVEGKKEFAQGMLKDLEKEMKKKGQSLKDLQKTFPSLYKMLVKQAK